jgi:hypothetical protein
MSSAQDPYTIRVNEAGTSKAIEVQLASSSSVADLKRAIRAAHDRKPDVNQQTVYFKLVCIYML